MKKTKKRLKVLAVVQARMTSARLPGKALADILGKPNTRWIIERLQAARELDGVILGITDQKEDDPLAELAQEINVPFYRGRNEELVEMYYEITKKFPQYEHDNLTSQLRRAATGLPLNIAEGSGSWSRRVFLNFLGFAYRSSKECDAALRLAKDLAYISEGEYKDITNKLDLFMRTLYKFMCSVESQVSQAQVQRNYFYQQQKYYLEQDLKEKEQVNEGSKIN